MRDRIDGILIDPDENGFHLILSGEELEYNFTLGLSAALELLRAVKSEIEPWYYEGAIIVQHDVGGYSPDDPKSEGYHDRMAAIWDDREKG